MSEAALSEKNKRLLAALGMSVKAGAAICGVPMVCEALGSQKKGKRPIIVFEASDTSENTHKRVCDKCAYYGVRHVRLEIDGGMLAEALGKRSMLGAVALTDENLCRLVEKYV